MTTPDERTRAVLETREFLRELLDSERMPGVPALVREQARRLLRHYPDSTPVNLAHLALPHWWGPPQPDTSASKAPAGNSGQQAQAA